MSTLKKNDYKAIKQHGRGRFREAKIQGAETKLVTLTEKGWKKHYRHNITGAESLRKNIPLATKKGNASQLEVKRITKEKKNT